MIVCPVCGLQMRKGDINDWSFRCPGCKERLRPDFHPRLVGIMSIVAAFLIPFLAGARGVTLFGYGICLWFPIALGYAAVRAIFFHKLVKDTSKEKDGFPHVVPPPGG